MMKTYYKSIAHVGLHVVRSRLEDVPYTFDTDQHLIHSFKRVSFTVQEVRFEDSKHDPAEMNPDVLNVSTGKYRYRKVQDRL